MSAYQINRFNKSQNYTLTAPLGGLNASDSWDAMSPNDALVMENYMPQDTKVSLRKGYRKIVTLPQKVRTLLSYTSEQGQNRLFAFSGKSVYDITTPTNVIDFQKNYTSDIFQTATFKNRLFAVNGYDKIQTFYINEEGVGVFEDANFQGTNLHPEKLVNVAVSKQRLWFVEKNTLRVWYSENAGEVQGKLLSMDLSTVATKGGSLVAVACWTQDGGQGIDDLTVFITSLGEVLVYAGSNPNNANDWALKGVYKMATPLGYRCVLAYQGDIVILSEEGFIPLSKALPLQGANIAQIAFSNKIAPLVRETVATNATKHGWQGMIYPRGGIAIFNAPKENQFMQFVINLNSGAWCTFSGIRAFCWELFQGRAYFGSDDGVMLFDEGYSDNGIAIKGRVEQAYSDLGTPNLKKVQLLNPRTKSSAPFALVIYTNTDFDTKYQKYSTVLGSKPQSLWNKTLWSSLKDPSGSFWATLRGTIRSQWIGNRATGFKISLVFQTNTKGTLIEWFSTGLRFETSTGII